MRKLLITCFSFLLLACSNDDAKVVTPIAPQVALGQSINSDSFNLSFSAIMTSYLDLKNAFIKEDTSLIHQSAKKLANSAALVKLNELNADTLIINTAKIYTQNLQDEIMGLLKEQDLENKRKSFQIITNDVYDLIRTVRYDREKVYLQHCPMAFKNKGADWLSNSSEIENPYLPKMMLDCGEVIDSAGYNK